MNQTWWWGWRWGLTIILANRLIRAWWWPALKRYCVVPECWLLKCRCARVAGIAFNGWTLDTTRCELSDPQRNTVPLTQGEYGLLLALTQNARRVLSRDRLLELTHSESADVFDRTIDVLIMRLRRKIEANPHQPALIKTIRGLGYVFAADVSHSEKAA